MQNIQSDSAARPHWRQVRGTTDGRAAVVETPWGGDTRIWTGGGERRLARAIPATMTGIRIAKSSRRMKVHATPAMGVGAVTMANVAV